MGIDEKIRKIQGYKTWSLKKKVDEAPSDKVFDINGRAPLSDQ